MTVAKAVGDLATVTVAWRRGARRRRRHIWKGRDGDDAVVADGGGGRPTGKRKEAAQLGLARLGLRREMGRGEKEFRPDLNRNLWEFLFRGF